ncbi:hypothetical protein [Nocardia caishijiensis]|uniref:Uncharacterized protein n=1 Tax=Nocardia caishijiensis TaxID=184756 RepID=A0ABQ6YRX7_9NOCA|nr:hypothetical protein [Nocardia caishijiensis]KAF0848246.1 hypothetical protein FNL39_102394 [Nocardia caishijiensis]
MGTPMDDWRGYRNSGSLKLEDGAATEAAEYCADVLDIIALVEGKVGEIISPDTTGAGQTENLLGHLTSGRALTQEFYTLGREFRDDVLKDHKQVLNDMALSFLIAGNNYKNKDQDSKDELSRILSTRNPAEGIVHAEQHVGQINPRDTAWIDNTRGREPGEYKKTDTDKSGQYGGLPSGANTPKESLKTVSASHTAEPGSTLNYTDFYNLGISLRRSSWLRDMSSDWHRMASQMSRGFSDYDTRIRSLVDSKERWTGRGAGDARDAVHRYTGRGLELTRTMYRVSELLLDAYNWAQTTQANMPDKPADQLNAHERKTWEDHARTVFNNWYRPGYAAAIGALPALPGPAGTARVTEEPPGKPTNPGSPGNPAGGGGGSQNNDAATAAQLKAQQDAAHQQQLAALQQAEAQRKAQEQAAKDAERAAAQKAAQQQQQQAQETASQALQQLATQAASQASQIGEQISAAAEQAAAQAAQQASMAGLSGIPTSAAALDEAAKKMGLAGAKGGGGGGAGGGLGAKAEGQNLEKASKLFPRATATTDLAAMASRAGLASAAGAGAGMPMGGPMGGGGAGAGAGGQQKDHKRADYLDSVEHLEEAIGEAQTVVRPVVEQ